MMIGNVAATYETLGLYRNAVPAAGRGRGARPRDRCAGPSDVRARQPGERRNQARPTSPRRAQRLAELSEEAPNLGDAKLDCLLESITGELELAAGDAKGAVRHMRRAAVMAHRGGAGHRDLLPRVAGHARSLPPATPRRRSAQRRKRSRCIAGRSSRRPTRPVAGNLVVACAGARRQRPAREGARRPRAGSTDSCSRASPTSATWGCGEAILNKVIANRGILAAWVADATARKLPRQRALAHLITESNVREPFKRLADTGLRLNALRDDAAIRRSSSRRRSKYPAPSACCCSSSANPRTKSPKPSCRRARTRPGSRARSSPISHATARCGAPC